LKHQVCSDSHGKKDSLCLTGLPGFNRFPCEHQIVPIPNYEGIAWDDIWRFNPQASSQWDGFRHYSADMGDGTRKWYGGTTSDEISQGKSDRIGVGHWAQQGIAARGVFIDYVSYAEVLRPTAWSAMPSPWSK
jgi:hypothetical protein